MNTPKLSPRLLAAADLVRPMATLADVGTDHAYLPIYLCKLGKIRSAIASDINEGPVERAKINIASHSLARKISVKLTDGLSGLREYSPTDIVICGMGGELIISIISAAEWTKDKSLRLILQPMTHADKLRAYLIGAGFSIIEERLAKEEKVYQIICAEYSGESAEYSPIELIFGKQNIERGGEELRAYAEYVRSVFEVRLLGKQKAGSDTSEEESMLSGIDQLLMKKGR
ncbi:MAG: SAM-dependent methyltransferase [Clostridia bacterium]|nr:SAM-dependent methyltransferase [Clostridia bacterium]